MVHLTRFALRHTRLILLAIEGENLIAEALRSKLHFDTVFVREGSADVLRRPALEHLLPMFTVGRSHFSPQLMILAIRTKLNCVEIPVHYQPRTGISKITGSTWKAFRLGLRMIKIHPPHQLLYPNDYLNGVKELEIIYRAAEANGIPVMFHTGTSIFPGARNKYGDPIYIDDVAVDFPDMTIIIAHPSWPWQDEALSVCLHKPNVFIDLSGWSPKYFPPQLVQRANGQLKTKMLFGSDWPLIQPDRWIKDFLEAGFKPEVHDLILKQNAIRALKIAA